MLILDGEAVRASYPMTEAISVMTEALRAFPRERLRNRCGRFSHRLPRKVSSR